MHRAVPEAQPVSARLLVALSLAAALAPLGSTMIAVALPGIGAELGTDPAALTGWLVTSYLVVGIVCQSPGGKAGDLIGHRAALAVGQALAGAGALLGLLGRGLPLLVAARVLAAAGGALLVPSAMAIARTRVPEAARGRAFGALGAVMALAAAIGPILGGELVARLGWRAIFGASLVPLLLSVALAHLGAVPALPGRRGARLDLPGSVLLGAALAALVGAARTGAPLLVTGAVAGLVLFVAWERRAAEPVLALGLFARRAFALGGLVIALQNLAMYALLFQLPQVFVRERHLGADQAGRSLLGLMAAMVVGAPAGARLSERIGPRATIGLGATLALAGLWPLRDLQALASPLAALPGLILVGAGLGLSTAPAQAAAMGAADRSEAGMAAGALSTMRYLGGVAGIAVLGALLGRGEGGAAIGVYAAALLLSGVAGLLLPGR